MTINYIPFQKRLEECDYHIVCRVEYIAQEMNNTDDDILETIKEIEGLKVELEIALKLEDYLMAENYKIDIAVLEEFLGYLEARYEILEDLFDEEYFNIMA